MFRTKRASTMGSTVADIASDLWKKRTDLLATTNKTALYFCFHIDASHYTDDASHEDSLYIHFLMEEEFWWATVNDVRYFAIDHDTLRFDKRDDERDGTYVSSWRYYAFSDVLSHLIEKKLDTIVAGFPESTAMFSLRSAFPLEHYHPTKNKP